MLTAHSLIILSVKGEHIKIIENSLSEKDIMLREMNHRVKNNLQIIISLLKIQISQTKNNIMKESYLKTISQLKSISIIHNMLYNNKNYTSVSGKKYLTELAQYIFQSLGVGIRIKIEYMIEDIELSLDQAVSLGIITNEIITNSIKYAFPDAASGIIIISLKLTDSINNFTISDNGIGLPEQYLDGKNNSIGINLIKTLSKQLKAELSIDNKSGTSYLISFS